MSRTCHGLTDFISSMRADENNYSLPQIERIRRTDEIMQEFMADPEVIMYDSELK